MTQTSTPAARSATPSILPQTQAAMWDPLFTIFLHLQNLLLGLNTSCPSTEQLPVNTVDRQQYLGTWHFRAVVSRREADIAKFRAMDSMWFNMEEAENDTLRTTGHMRVLGSCVKQTWTYKIHLDRDDLELQARPQRRNPLLSGRWVKCPECIIFQEVEPPVGPTGSEDSINRLMLYTRQNDTNPSVVALFLKRAACHNMTASVTLPRQKELCT